MRGAEGTGGDTPNGVGEGISFAEDTLIGGAAGRDSSDRLNLTTTTLLALVNQRLTRTLCE